MSGLCTRLVSVYVTLSDVDTTCYTLWTLCVSFPSVLFDSFCFFVSLVGWFGLILGFGVFFVCLFVWLVGWLVWFWFGFGFWGCCFCLFVCLFACLFCCCFFGVCFFLCVFFLGGGLVCFIHQMQVGGTVYICECKFVYMSEREGVGVKVCVIVKCKRKSARYTVQ